MIKDNSGFKRYIGVFGKEYNENGNSPLVMQYELKYLELTFLHKIFHISADKDDDPISYFMLYDYTINEEQATALQPYVIGGTLDLKKYDYLLECYDASECKHSEEYLKSIK